MIKLTPEKPPYYENVEPIKIYIALLTQSGTDNPIVIVLRNTIGNIVWTRTGTGQYLGTLAEAFPLNKTTLNSPNITGTSGTPQTTVFSNQEDGEPSNSLNIKTLDDGVATDGLLYKTTIQITVYN